MLDGMVLLMNVYPKLLPYEYGMGHFEILERPIPRAWWPGKPIGGYMNKLGFFDAGSGGTIGISPTLFGSFYQEGNWVAIILFSVIYGWALARLGLLQWQASMLPDLSITKMIARSGRSSRLRTSI